MTTSLVSSSGTTELVQRLGQFATATISDAQKSLGIMRPNIKALAPGMRLVGPAHTVKCYPGSIITVHKALLEARPGEVLVVDGEGDDRGALFGELMTLQALRNGVAGVVVDGPVRDRNAATTIPRPRPKKSPPDGPVTAVSATTERKPAQC